MSKNSPSSQLDYYDDDDEPENHFTSRQVCFQIKENKSTHRQW